MTDCAGAEGTCDRPAAKAGLCWAHYERKLKLAAFGPGRLARKAIAQSVEGYASDPRDGLYRAALRYKDELDTATDEEFRLARERFRDALRRYLWDYVPALLKRAEFSPPTRAEIDRFLEKYGDKAAHHQPKRVPTQHQRSSTK